MQHTIKKWTFRFILAGLFLAGLLLGIVLNPMVSYANNTHYKNFSIYHHEALDPAFLVALDQSQVLLETSEYYDPNLTLDVCLHDGSVYPSVIKAIRGEAFAWGFYDKVVLQGTLSCKDNYLALNGYQWNLVQLLAHEMTHCLQFHQLGLKHSNPVANIPAWKWEGYPEYVARQNSQQQSLANNIVRLQQTPQNTWAVSFEDGSIAPRAYYEYWLLVQYCMDVKNMTYQQLLADQTSEQDIQREMMEWFERNQ
jgi:hypothetical protein